MARAKLVKLHNPTLMAVNPFKKSATPARRRNGRKPTPAAAKNKKKNPSLRAARNPFDVAGILKKGTAAGAGALATTFVANLLPLPTNPLLNAGSKALVGIGLGYLAKSIGPAKDVADFVMAGGVGVAAADGIRFLIPKLRTVIVPTPEQAAATKALAPGELNDVVYADGGMGDVVDSMNYDSSWATN